MNDQADAPTDPRLSIGGNNPPLAKQISETENFAAEVTQYLRDEYAEIPRTVAELLAEFEKMPKKITTREQRDDVARLIKRMRDMAARIEAMRRKEKEPYFRGGQAVDTFAFGEKDKVARRDDKAKPGAADFLQHNIDEYTQQLLAEQQAERDRQAREAKRLADEARERQEKADREAREAREAADRARSPTKIEEKNEVASKQEEAASVAAAAAQVADQKAEEAYVHSLAKPADMVRERVADGPTVTMQKENYAVIEDESLLDKEALWPFILLDAKEKALRAWAKTTGHSKQMAGAKVGSRPKTRVQ